MYLKTGADIGFADETAQALFCNTPFVLDYDPTRPFADGLFPEAAPGCLKANLADIAHKRNF